MHVYKHTHTVPKTTFNVYIYPLLDMAGECHRIKYTYGHRRRQIQSAKKSYDLKIRIKYKYDIFEFYAIFLILRWNGELKKVSNDKALSISGNF